MNLHVLSACVLCLVCLTAGCAGGSVEDRLVRLESFMEGQVLLDMRLAKVEDTLLELEQQRLASPEKGKKNSVSGKMPHPAPAPRVIPPPVVKNALLPASKGINEGTQGNTSAVDRSLYELAEDVAPASVKTSTPKSGVVSVAPSGSYKPLKGEVSSTPLSGLHFSHAVDTPEADIFTFSREPLGIWRYGFAPEGAQPAQDTIVSQARDGTKAPMKSVSKRTETIDKSQYDRALAAYERRDMKQAESLFKAYVAANPKSKLAPNALYWLGECYYAQGQYATAIVSFKDVVAKYPKDAKAAAALLKAGYTYAKLQDFDNAKFYWTILVEDFPQSAPAALAKKRLAGL